MFQTTLELKEAARSRIRFTFSRSYDVFMNTEQSYQNDNVKMQSFIWENVKSISANEIKGKTFFLRKMKGFVLQLSSFCKGR